MMVNGQMNNKQMHICLVIGGHYPPYPHGGVGSFAVDLAEGLVNRGHKITCISFYSKQVLQSGSIVVEMIHGVKVVRVPKPYENYPPRVRAVMEKLYIAKLIRGLHQQDSFDLVEGEDGGGRLGFGRLPDIPKVIRLHATSIYNDFELRRKPSRLNHIFEYLWLRRANVITAVSDYVGKTTLKLIHLDKHKNYEVIYPSIDIDFFKSDPSIAPESGLIVFTGAVAPRKGVIELIQSMNVVFARHEKARLAIVGDNSLIFKGSSYFVHVLAQLNKKYKDRVTFMGKKLRAEMPAILQQAEICCFPSHVETFGIGIAEAMAMEKPVIYMKSGPGPEVVEDKVSGLLCDTWDPLDIAEKILFLFDHPDLAQKMGVNARQRVVEKFEKDVWVNRNLMFYEDCIRNYKAKGKRQYT